MIIHRVTSLLLGMAFSLSAIALEPCYKVRFPASGQTLSYQIDINSGADVFQRDVPDDGAVEAGATLRYRDNGNGTIRDLNTRLMWEKKSDDGGLHDKDSVYSWSEGETIWSWLEKVNTERRTGFAGYSDWRIPNVKELQSIIDYERFDPALDPLFYLICVPGVDVRSGNCTAHGSPIYWSSTTFYQDTIVAPDAWGVDLSTGGSFIVGKSSNLSVLAVRGGCS